jgi:hypothetical protein
MTKTITNENAGFRSEIEFILLYGFKFGQQAQPNTHKMIVRESMIEDFESGLVMPLVERLVLLFCTEKLKTLKSFCKKKTNINSV